MAASRSSRWRWSEGTRKPVRYAAALGATIERIKSRSGAFSAKQVVAAARAKGSPIHGLFEWDNRKAAEKYREIQARDMIRCLVYVSGDGDGETEIPAAVSFGPGDGYVGAREVLSSADLRARLIRQALAEADSWRGRYIHLKELGAVFAAIDKIKVSLG